MLNFKSRVISFCLAFLLHFLLLLLFCWGLFEKNAAPPHVVVLDVVMIGEDVKHRNKIIRRQEAHHENQKQVKDLHHNSALNSPNQAQHFHSQSELDVEGSKDQQQKVVPLFNPLPQIPAYLRDEVFESEAVARFYLDKMGNVARVELIKACEDPRLNVLLLKSLRSWKFSASGKESVQDVRVKFRVD